MYGEFFKFMLYVFWLYHSSCIFKSKPRTKVTFSKALVVDVIFCFPFFCSGGRCHSHPPFYSGGRSCVLNFLISPLVAGMCSWFFVSCSSKRCRAFDFHVLQVFQFLIWWWMLPLCASNAYWLDHTKCFDKIWKLCYSKYFKRLSKSSNVYRFIESSCNYSLINFAVHVKQINVYKTHVNVERN